MLTPLIGRYMTRQPWTISSHHSLSEASAVMREHDIRHLPVVDDGQLVGVVSDRDVRLLQSLGGRGGTRVAEAMSEPAFSVQATAPVDEVARAMGEHKYGSVVVVTRGGAVEGIFTMVDACRALADIIERAVA